MAEFRATFQEPESLKVSFRENGSMSASFGETQLVTTSNYEELSKKPQINGVTLLGDKSFEDLGDASLSNLEIATIFNKVFGGN